MYNNQKQTTFNPQVLLTAFATSGSTACRCKGCKMELDAKFSSVSDPKFCKYCRP